jgi:hypothetical protein
VIKDLRKAKVENDIVEYVQKLARFYGGWYSVRHPTQYGNKSTTSDDTRDLVEKLCVEYNVDYVKAKGLKTRNKEKNNER